MSQALDNYLLLEEQCEIVENAESEDFSIIDFFADID